MFALVIENELRIEREISFQRYSDSKKPFAQYRLYLGAELSPTHSAHAVICQYSV